jgi:hypothetical protein
MFRCNRMELLPRIVLRTFIFLNYLICIDIYNRIFNAIIKSSIYYIITVTQFKVISIFHNPLDKRLKN